MLDGLFRGWYPKFRPQPKKPPHTERQPDHDFQAHFFYLGTKQDLVQAVNDRVKIRLKRE